HQERKRVRAAYIHKAQHLEERREMMQWWADYLDANRFRHVVPYGSLCFQSEISDTTA
ncbi:integrase, partial [Citrobacter portucalensis]|nr:integrase [Citrobacter portucalensis]